MLFRVLAESAAMINVAVQYFISFVQSAHGTAFLIGSSAFLLYTVFYPFLSSSAPSQTRRVPAQGNFAGSSAPCPRLPTPIAGQPSTALPVGGHSSAAIEQPHENGAQWWQMQLFREHWGGHSETQPQREECNRWLAALPSGTCMLVSLSLLVIVCLLREKCCVNELDEQESPETSWALDTVGYYVPADIAQLELQLLQAEAEVPSEELEEFSASRALQLYQHAKSLALAHHDAAAEWRYRECARIARSTNRRKLAAHSLSRLGYFLMLRGRYKDALATATEALEQDDDPLGAYVEAAMRRSLGHLKDSEEIDAVLAKLELLQGRLPSQGLEQQRAETYNEIAWWRDVSIGGFKDCLAANDAARFVICSTSHLLWHVAR